MLSVSGRTPAGAWKDQLSVPAVDAGEGSAAVVSLFGREAVEDLEVKRAAGIADVDRDIERIGLEFQIATQQTSWIAVSEEPAIDPTQPARRVRIPHALADGLSVEGLGLRPAVRQMGGMHVRSALSFGKTRWALSQLDSALAALAAPPLDRQPSASCAKRRPRSPVETPQSSRRGSSCGRIAI